VIDLQDKLNKADSATGALSAPLAANKAAEEALAALVMLGFSRTEAEKGLMKIKQQNPDYTVEDLVKHTLKIL
jgi:Holliday junction DNA helicase RuvA